MISHLRNAAREPLLVLIRPSRLPHVPARLWATLLILASAVASLAYSWLWTPLDLAPDEGHYWDWSRHLDWSYYSKGPLVAWIISVSCELLGPLSVDLTGELAAAIRTPAALFHAAFLAGWYVLARDAFGSVRFGLAVVALGVALPLVRVGGILMTIDPPFLACWCWGMVCVLRGLERGGNGWWFGAALSVAVGTLAKYTMALLPVAVVGYLIFHRRGEFRRAGIWILALGAALGWLPVIVWNAQHDWVSFRHVFGQVGDVSANRGVLPGAIGFIGGQFGMLFGFWLVAFWFAAYRFQPRREAGAGVQLLWWGSVPVWCLFAAASLVKPGQPNWPAPAYVGGFVLAVAWVRDQLMGRHPRAVRWGVCLSVLGGVAVTFVVQFPYSVRPVIARFVSEPTELNPLPVRRFDLTARLTGWKDLAAEVDRQRARLRAETGAEPVIVGTHWTLPGELGVYCKGHPEVFTIGAVNGSDRHSQYDLWRPNPVADAQEFRGRSFIIVGDLSPVATRAFERFEAPTRVVHAGAGVPVARWAVWVGHDFRGFDRESPGTTTARY